MRPVALGRKNWIHIGSPQAGPKVAAILSIVETCRRLKIPVRQTWPLFCPGWPMSVSSAWPNSLPLLGLDGISNPGQPSSRRVGLTLTVLHSHGPQPENSPGREPPCGHSSHRLPAFTGRPGTSEPWPAAGKSPRVEPPCGHRSHRLPGFTGRATSQPWPATGSPPGRARRCGWCSARKRRAPRGRSGRRGILPSGGGRGRRLPTRARGALPGPG